MYHRYHAGHHRLFPEEMELDQRPGYRTRTLPSDHALFKILREAETTLAHAASDFCRPRLNSSMARSYVHVAYGCRAGAMPRSAPGIRGRPAPHQPNTLSNNPSTPSPRLLYSAQACRDIISRHRRPRIATDETIPPSEHMGQGQNSKPSRLILFYSL